MRVHVVTGAFVFLTFGAASANQVNEWFSIGMTADGQSVKLNPSRMKRTGPDTIEAWTRFETADVPPNAKAKPKGSAESAASHDLFHYRFFCDTKSLQLLSNYSYSKSGSVLHSSTTPSTKNVVVPESVGESLLNAVCRYANSGAI